MINPTDPSTTQNPIYNPMMPVGQNEEQELPPTQSMATASPFSSIDKQFASLIKDLSQQLSALEKQLMQALREIKLGGQATSKPSPVSQQGNGLSARSGRFGNIIDAAARRNEVDPQLVTAVINQESGFRADAVSKAGAIGLMQLMPDTAKSLGVANPFDPTQNVEGGTALLRGLLDRYHGQLDLALAAYNAGPAAVDKYGGVPPYPETQAYVRNIMAAYRESALSA